MRRGVGFAALLAVFVGTPALAQMGPSSPLSGIGSGVWQSGAAPLPYFGREMPNVQPLAPTQPVGNQPEQISTQNAPIVTKAAPADGGTWYFGGTGGVFYDDNVFATNIDRMHDWAFFERPEVAWVKQGQNYTFTADGFVEGREYVTFNSEDQINGGTGGTYTVMPDDNTQIIASAHYLHEHLDRGASETVISPMPGVSELISSLFTHPVAYDEGIESAALNKRYGNWWSSVGAAGLEIHYQNAVIGSILGVTPGLTGDTVNFNYADGEIGAANGRIGYVVMPLTSVFAEVAGNTRDWGVSYLDSNGFRVDAGMLFEQGPGARLKGEFWAGYMNQAYNGATMQTISTWTYGANLSAIITDDLTAVIYGRREPKEAVLALATLSGPPGMATLGATDATCMINASACVSDIETEADFRLDYRIMPRVVIGGGMTYLEDDYQGPAALGRVDRTYGPLASLKYFATPNLTFGFDYRNVSFSTIGGTGPGFLPVNALPFFKDLYIFSVSGRF